MLDDDLAQHRADLDAEDRDNEHDRTMEEILQRERQAQRKMIEKHRTRQTKKPQSGH